MVGCHKCFTFLSLPLKWMGFEALWPSPPCSAACSRVCGGNLQSPPSLASRCLSPKRDMKFPATASKMSGLTVSSQKRVRYSEKREGERGTMERGREGDYGERERGVQVTNESYRPQLLLLIALTPSHQHYRSFIMKLGGRIPQGQANNRNPIYFPYRLIKATTTSLFHQQIS